MAKRGKKIPLHLLLEAERATDVYGGPFLAAKGLGVSPATVRTRLRRLEELRAEGAQADEDERLLALPKANLGTLQNAHGPKFELYVNQILAGERLYAPVKRYKHLKEA